MIASLKDVREKMLGYRLDFVARQTTIERERLEEIESGSPPDFWEIDSLARIYGIEAERLLETTIHLVPGDGIEVLTSLAEFRDIDDRTRLKIVTAANAARDLVTLQKRLYPDEDPRNAFAKESPHLVLDQQQKHDRSYQQGAALARQLRTALRLENQPIVSMRDLVHDEFPSLAVLHADLGQPAGLAFADPLRGPAIVLNTKGKNRNPRVRRFSLAHELCHLLVDWNRREPLVEISGYLNERGLDRERRANAFAVRLLCPPPVIRKLEKLDDPMGPEARTLFAEYGLPYAAWSLYAHNELGIGLPRSPRHAWTDVDNRWSQAEEPHNVQNFPLDRVPTERRTRIAQMAAELYSHGQMSRDEFAEMLGVTPSAEVEQVLDFFEFEPPFESLAV